VRPREVFRKVAHATAAAIGSPYAFLIGILAIAAWAACGPMLGYSNTWQLVINTGTTIATFLVVFLIQNTQNRDSQAIHLKLDELIRSAKTARNKLLDIEELPDEELARLEDEFRRLRMASESHVVRRARHNRRHRHARRPRRALREDQPRNGHQVDGPQGRSDELGRSTDSEGRDLHRDLDRNDADRNDAQRDSGDAGEPDETAPRRVAGPRRPTVRR
jgi:low affinity Fe/Cu permease